MKFPQYRRYKNGLSYFIITDLSHFEEYKLLGNTLEKYSIEATILPDRNFIQDMLTDYSAYWEKIDQKTFDHFCRSYPIRETWKCLYFC